MKKRLLKKIVRFTILAAIFITTRYHGLCQQSIILQSPDAHLSISFQTESKKDTSEKNNKLLYSVSFNGKKMLEPSGLNLDIKGNAPLGSNVRIVKSQTSTVDTMYHLITGKTSEVRDHYKALRLEVEEISSPNRRLIVEARAYNDAIAFRYIVPTQQGLDAIEVENENTEFHFSKDATTYSLVLPHYQSMYESEYLKLPISAFSNQGGVNSHILIGLPMLTEVPGVGWLAITEADLKGYSSMYLTNPSGGWNGHTLLSRLSPKKDTAEIAVSAKGSLQSAWRVLIIGSTAGKIIESNATMNLNPPSVVENTSWIKAGKASWDWWSGSIGADGKPAFTTENMKYYVDFASRSGFEYMLVDAGWSGNDLTKMNGKVDIPALVDYAKNKNVKVWIWAYAGSVAKQMEEAFSLFEKWGVAGVKIDFIERDDQQGIQFYFDVAENAARHHLMIDFHGCTKPFGLERTYPNVMNYEGVLGMEQSKGGTRDNPDNHAMLPFTRMLTGPMDYTPGGFDNVTREEFIARSEKPMVMGTRSHHLALYVVLQAAFEMVADHPAAYKDEPGFEFIKQIPATWDEIKVLNGAPGEYVTIARRKGKEWYLGSITNWQGRAIDAPLSFLGAGKYNAEIYADAPDAGRNPKHVLISKQIVTKNTILHPKLVSGGGYSVHFAPIR